MEVDNLFSTESSKHSEGPEQPWDCTQPFSWKCIWLDCGKCLTQAVFLQYCLAGSALRCTSATHPVKTYVDICIYIYIHIKYNYIYYYICLYRERESKYQCIERLKVSQACLQHTVCKCVHLEAHGTSDTIYTM